jgi:hypothetical protein
MARAVTWSRDDDRNLTIIVHPSGTGKREIKAHHQGEFKQLELFHSEKQGGYFYPTIQAKRKGK